MSPTFSESLRAATLPAHDVANHHPYISVLLGGEPPIDAFAALSTQLYFIYSALEEAAESMREDPVGGRFVFDELTRAPSLRTDMEYYHGPEWEAKIYPNRATEAYCERIKEVAHSWPGGFVAHHYTRYLGDIAGGQAIRTRMRRLHGLEGAGTLFYVFDQIPSPPRFRDNYRELLNTSPWDAHERKRVIMESVHAFELNVGVFTALAEEMPAYLMR